MTSAPPQTTNLTIRPFQHRDLEGTAELCAEDLQVESYGAADMGWELQQLRRWYGLLKVLSFFPNPFQHLFCAYIAEQGNRIRGMIEVSPFNRTRSTWRVDRVVVDRTSTREENLLLPIDIGSQLLRHCFQAIWEARTWLIEVNVNDKAAMALYRQNGFQSLAEMTYWSLAPEALQALAEREPDLPNLLPISNADAGLLYQLDTASMPPLVRQVFDRHVIDFKTNLFRSTVDSLKHWFKRTEVACGYVFEPQRKAAIGYFQIQLCRDGSQPHTAQLTVHPAYTWLYPEMLAQMARITQGLPPQSLQLASSDYQPEREEYLQQVGAQRVEHTLMMSRSVWHKLKETKPMSLEGLQLSEMLQGLQPARKPVPGRFSLINQINKISPKPIERSPAVPSSEPLSPAPRNSTKSGQSDGTERPPYSSEEPSS
ncbi:GNAT family N-acetyltransferase [Oculatella sp. LEGE 06141]|uniref:GNAT family N-acetyltransferase n=1 Tax=Oculatella sp. LEGE 06141 TaxID=1828648 RepID=UPI0018816C1B|nr:GNAT family N-acetyltransferase [Oculatella sp. LEGE 06141]MBE9180719.1 GNAT family N-acetyltransferase [Oculatella sp. LEGE 06141]